MDRTELENLIRFAKKNGMMNWALEEVLNEYETTKMHHKEPKFDPKTFQPFDKVLIKDNSFWTADFFSYIAGQWVNCVGCGGFECVPYNEETKHLLGTREDCPEYYSWWKK